MATRIMMVEGMDGQVELLPDRVIIHRKGFWNALKYGMNARREIPLAAISEVSFKEANFFMFGEIDFVRAGARDDSKKKKSAVKFKKPQQFAFVKFKEKVFERMNQNAKQK